MCAELALPGLPSPTLVLHRSGAGVPGAWTSATDMVCSTRLQIHTWDRFDVFKVAALTQGRPLYTVAMAIFEALGLMVSADMPQAARDCSGRVRVLALLAMRFTRHTVRPIAAAPAGHRHTAALRCRTGSWIGGRWRPS